MKLFSKSKPGVPIAAASATPTFQPIDRANLLAVLDRVVNQGENCVIRLREPRGAWTYAFQAGGLTHASGGMVRGARQAFDLLWEFQYGEINMTGGVDPTLSSNLYIDKGRLLDLLHRSQAALTGPHSPYIPPDQQRPIQPVRPPQWPPGGAQRPPAPPPGWSPPPGYAAAPQGYPSAAPAPQGSPAQAPQGYPPAPPRGYPAPPAQAYPQGQPVAPPPGYPPAYPAPPASGPAPQPAPPYPGYPAQAQPYPPAQPVMQPPPQQIAPPPPPMAPPRPQPRPAAPSFSVPPMPLPKPRGTVNLQPPQPPPPPVAAPVLPSVADPNRPVTPVDELKTLRATLVSQAPTAPPPAAAPPPNWNMRGPGGPVAPPPAAKQAKGPKVTRPSPLREWGRVQLISFLLWACERRYSPDDHWTVKDAFEVATLELRDQFLGAFSQSLQNATKGGTPRQGEEFEGDQIASGRTRGRSRGKRR